MGRTNGERGRTKVGTFLTLCLIGAGVFVVFAAGASDNRTRPQIDSGSARVIDGDTIEIDGVTYRLQGIDAPELKQGCSYEGKSYRCGKIAASMLSVFTEGLPVTCEGRDRDRYNRVIAVCRVLGQDLAWDMLRSGWAMVDTRYNEDPNYVVIEAAARSTGRGIWQGEVTPPWEWRKSK